MRKEINTMIPVQKLADILGYLVRPLERCGGVIVFGLAAFWLNHYFTDYPRPVFWPHFWMIAIDLYLVATLISLLPRRWCITFQILWFVGMYLMDFTECFLYARFYIIYAPAALTLCLETNSGEASEFLSSCIGSTKFWPTLWPWLLLLVIQLGWVGLGFLQRKYLRLSSLARNFSRTVVGLVLVGYFVFMLPQWCSQRSEFVAFFLAQDSGEAERAPYANFSSSSLRLANSIKFYVLAQREMDRLAECMQQIRVDSCSEECPHIVLLIGESYNRMHSQVYGYPLNTTPHQQQMVEEGSMVRFDHVVTPWNLTSNVFKNMLSLHSVDQPGNWTSAALFPAIFRKAGYHVSFITNQFQRSNRQNKADFNGSFFLNDQRFDSLCFDYRNTKKYKYDTGLIRELDKEELKAIRQPRLTIVHLMGQHLVYRERFAESKTVFHVSDYNRPDLTMEDRQVIADYDNATLFNDEVVAKLLRKFEEDDVLVIYLSDHGDEVFDGNIGMYGRNHSAELTPAILRAEFDVPFEIWGSPKFRKLHAPVWAKIRAASELPFMTDDMPHLLLGLAGIHGPYYDAERDLLSPSYNSRRPRLLKDGAGNYDEIMSHE